MTKALVFTFSFALGVTLCADELHEQMEKVGKANGVLRKAVPAKSMTDISTAAGTLAEVFPLTVAAWEKRNMADAVQWTKEAETYSKDLKLAADAGNGENVSAAFSKLGGTCKSCHTAHREEIPDTNPKKYRIK